MDALCALCNKSIESRSPASSNRSVWGNAFSKAASPARVTVLAPTTNVVMLILTAFSSRQPCSHRDSYSRHYHRENTRTLPTRQNDYNNIIDINDIMSLLIPKVSISIRLHRALPESWHHGYSLHAVNQL